MSKNVYNTRGANNTINQASDVAISNLQNGQELVWDALANKWVNQTVSSGKENLSELLDVSLVEPSNAELLKYDNNIGKWVNGRANLTELSDTSITAPTANQILRYDAGLAIWQNSNETVNAVSSVFTRTGAVTAQSGDYSLGQISGVSLAGPTTNQVLKYNGSNFANTFLSDNTYNLVDVNVATVTAAYDTIYRVNAGTINMIPSQQDRVIKIIVIQGTLLTLNFPGLLVYINNVGYFDEPFQVTEACYIELNHYAGTAWIMSKLSSRIVRVSTGKNISYSTPALSGLLDANISAPSLNQILRYNGSAWINSNETAIPVSSVFGRTGAVVAAEGDYSLTQLSDATITAPTNNQILRYNGSQWINSSESASPVSSVFGRTGIVVATEGDYSLTQLSDVTISAPVQGDSLNYDGVGWVNGKRVGAYTYNSDGNLANNNFLYLGYSQNANETRTQIYLPYNISITQLNVLLTVAPGVGNSRTFKVRIDGLDAITIVISGTSTTGSASLIYPVAQGQLLSLQNISAGAAAAVGLANIKFNYN